MQHASGMPCTLPLGLVPGVFMSVCASIQIIPSLFLAIAQVFRYSRDGADRDGMIAAENQRELALRERRSDHLRQSRTGLGDLRKIFRMRAARPAGFRAAPRARCRDPPLRIPKLRQASVQIGDAQRGRAHVDAAAAGAKIERRADDRDV